MGTACSNIWTDRKCTNRIRNARENGKLENMCTKWNAGLSCERSCRDLHYSHRNTKCPGDCPKAAIAVEGYFPVFAERLCAQQADANGAAHGHKLGINNATWWMPSTGTGFWHGDYPGADAARAAAGVQTTSLLRTAKGKKVPSKNKNNNNKKKTKKKAAAAGTKSKKKNKAAAAAAAVAKPKDATESSNANATANAIGN